MAIENPKSFAAVEGSGKSQKDLDKKDSKTVDQSAQVDATNTLDNRRKILEISRLELEFGGISHLRKIEKRDIEGPLDAVLGILQNEPENIRPKDKKDRPGGLIELKKDIPTILIPDLHGRRDFLFQILETQDDEGTTNLEKLLKGEIQVVSLGDALHTESLNKAPERWQKAATELLDSGISSTPSYVTPTMENEIADSFGTIAMIMKLKELSPENFHYIRGNHDDTNETYTGFRKFAAESAMVKNFIIEKYGQDFLTKYAEFEENLPFLAQGKDFFCSHALPNSLLNNINISETLDKAKNCKDDMKGVFMDFCWSRAEDYTKQEKLNEDFKNQGIKYYFGHEKFGDPLSERPDLWERNVICIHRAGDLEEYSLIDTDGHLSVKQIEINPKSTQNPEKNLKEINHIIRKHQQILEQQFKDQSESYLAEQLAKDAEFFSKGASPEELHTWQNTNQADFNSLPKEQQGILIKVLQGELDKVLTQIEQAKTGLANETIGKTQKQELEKGLQYLQNKQKSIKSRMEIYSPPLDSNKPTSTVENPIQNEIKKDSSESPASSSIESDDNRGEEATHIPEQLIQEQTFADLAKKIFGRYTTDVNKIPGEMAKRPPEEQILLQRAVEIFVRYKKLYKLYLESPVEDKKNLNEEYGKLMQELFEIDKKLEALKNKPTKEVNETTVPVPEGAKDPITKLNTNETKPSDNNPIEATKGKAVKSELPNWLKIFGQMVGGLLLIGWSALFGFLEKQVPGRKGDKK